MLVSILLEHVHAMASVVDDMQGFVRIAVRTGSPLVPVLSFGENNMFQVSRPLDDTFTAKLQRYCKFHTALLQAMPPCWIPRDLPGLVTSGQCSSTGVGMPLCVLGYVCEISGVSDPFQTCSAVHPPTLFLSWYKGSMGNTNVHCLLGCLAGTC